MSQTQKVRLELLKSQELLSSSKDKRVVELYTYVLKNLEHNPNTQNGVLDLTIRDIAEALDISERTVHYHKDRLIELGLLRVEQGRYNARWTILPFAVLKSRIAVLGNFAVLSENCSPKVQSSIKSTTDPIENIESLNTDTRLSTDNTLNTDLKQKDSNIRITPSQDLNLDDLDTNVLTTKLKLNGKSKSKSFRETPEEKPIPPISVAEVLKFGNKFPYSNDPSWFDSFIWKWATERFTKHRIDFMMTISSLRLMKFKLKYFFDKIVKNDWNNAENYIKWYLNLKDKFVVEQVGFSFEFMISAACVNKYFLDVSRRPDPNKPAFYTEENRHLAKGTWVKE